MKKKIEKFKNVEIELTPVQIKTIEKYYEENCPDKTKLEHKTSWVLSDIVENQNEFFVEILAHETICGVELNEY